MAFDDVPGLRVIVDVDRDEALFGEIVGGVGSAVIKGQGVAEKGVRQLLGEVMIVDMIFDRNMKSVRVEGLGLIVHRFDAMTKDIQFRQFTF